MPSLRYRVDIINHLLEYVFLQYNNPLVGHSQNPTWTALNNPGGEKCESGDCADKLAWIGDDDQNPIGYTVAGFFQELKVDPLNHFVLILENKVGTGANDDNKGDVICMCKVCDLSIADGKVDNKAYFLQVR